MKNSMTSRNNAIVVFDFKFVVGKCVEACWSIDIESMLYKDMIQGNFDEGYFNLSLKTNFMLQYANNYSRNISKTDPNLTFDFTVKVDDDSYVNIRLLGAVLAQTVSRNAYGGVCGSFDRPKRDKSNKFYVPSDIFPHRIYPAHCQGPLYYLSSDLVAKTSQLSEQYDKLYNRSSDFRVIARFEDILVGYYIYLSSISNISTDNHVNKVYLMRSNRFGPVKHYVQVPHYSVHPFGFEKVPDSSMFSFGDFIFDPLPENAIKLAVSPNRLGLSNEIQAKIFVNQFKLDSELSSHSQSKISKFNKFSTSLDKMNNRSISDRLNQFCTLHFGNIHHVIAYHRVNTHGLLRLNYCFLQ